VSGVTVISAHVQEATAGM